MIIGKFSSYFNFIFRVVVVWGDGVFPSTPGSPAAPILRIYRHMKQVSRMLGVFPQGHALAGHQRLVVLKVDENYSSQIPSCWPDDVANHHPLPNVVPPVDQRLAEVDGVFRALQCPHCLKIWNRDVNACRYFNDFMLTLSNIKIETLGSSINL